MNVFDRFISLFAPQFAYKRSLYRTKINLLGEAKRTYEAASKSNRFSMWNYSNQSADQMVKGSAQELCRKARDLVNNNPYAARAVEVLANNVVGTGVIPNVNHNNKKKEKKAKDAFKKWCVESTIIDKDKESNIYGLQYLFMSSIIEDGDCFAVRQKLKRSEKGKPNFAVKLLSADYLDHNKNEDRIAGGGKIKQGIEYDSDGNKVAYWFFKAHPSEHTGANEYSRVLIDDVIHGFDKKRVNQGRGVTRLHPVIIRLRELDVFEDAALKKQQVAACFSAFIYDSTPDATETDAEIGEKLETGNIEILPAGKDIKFANPPSNTDESFTKRQLFAIATGIGITYEALTNDYGNVNFSSGRMGWLEFHRLIKRLQRDIIINQFMLKFMAWFFEGLNLATPEYINLDDEGMEISYTLPAREMIDPSKEVPANIKAVEAGFKSRSKVIREGGENPDVVFEEISKERTEFKRLGLEFKGESKDATNTDSENNGSDAENGNES